jgi:uncharacterized membrane protein (UPF0127 family)
LFLDEDGRVVHMIHALKPYHISPLIGNSAMVLELPAGILQETGTEVGDWIEVSLFRQGTVRKAQPHPTTVGAK